LNAGVKQVDRLNVEDSTQPLQVERFVDGFLARLKR
jgi:hypothetical protein